MLDFIKALSLEAGALCLSEFENLSSSDIHFKNDKDLVTEADRKVEDFIINSIKKDFPEHSIFGEETGKTEGDSDFCWIIDPIDGTTSFVHGQPFFSVSIALQKKGVTVAGAVYGPKLQELFYAAKGRGAFLNEKRIQVSKRDKLINSVLATGFACIRAAWKDNNLKYFTRIVPEVRGIRRFGSAALDLSYVAAGRLEGFWEMNLQAYDVAAGILILEEAGGEICDFCGGDKYPENGTVATNSAIKDELLTYFK